MPVAGAPSGRFEWERSLRESNGLHSTTRLVLLTLGTYMNADGSRAIAGEERLARNTGLSARTVRHHLAAAVDAGWLRRVRRGQWVGSGAGGRAMASEYRATVPVGTGTALPVPDDENRQDPAGCEDGNRNLTTSEPEPDAWEPESDDTGTGGQPPPTTPLPADTTPPPPDPIDLEVRRRVRNFELRTGESAGAGMRRKIREEVETDLALDELLDNHDHPGPESRDCHACRGSTWTDDQPPRRCPTCAGTGREPADQTEEIRTP